MKILTEELAEKIRYLSPKEFLERREQIFQLRKEQKRLKKKLYKPINKIDR